MKKAKITFVLTITAFLCSLLRIYSQGTNVLQVQTHFGEPPPPGRAVEFLITTTNSADRFWATESLRMNRDELIGKLLAILDGPYSDAEKMDTLVILGEYRASGAVPFLVQHLEWDDVPPEHLPKTIWLYSHVSNNILEAFDKPVSTALEEIGMPAIPVLLDKVMQTDEAKIITKCVSICESIEGQDITQFRLQRLLEKETDPKTKARVRSALASLKNLKPEK